ncbi:DUF4367 domain-containing protein [Brevibacillus humidisoli]|uniref:DUF4367 domain-containing protein n=1 Tax=Brevibacillus humidisoli TaxID=2895522 RepID=UPI001E5721D1|nr:DUF4367 domain-containing protein [Brevibacillus humidisoli]UFJ41364.1 DUF4367 domain-containing protein [Brevibacillus humidisoli]
MKFKVGVLAAAGMLLTVSTAFAATNFTLTDKEGRVVFEEITPEQANYTPPTMEEMKRKGKSFDYADQLLKEGTAAIFYIVSDLPDMKLYTQDKSLHVTDSAALRAKMEGQYVTILDSLNGGYAFKDAAVTFTPMTYVNPLSPEEKAALAEKLKKQAEESKQDYAMQPVELSKDHWQINSTYTQNGKDVRVSMLRTSGKETLIFSEDTDFQREKLVVNGVDIWYTDFGAGKNVMWIYDVPGTGQTIRYHIETGNPVSKEELIEMAKAYLQQ